MAHVPVIVQSLTVTVLNRSSIKVAVVVGAHAPVNNLKSLTVSVNCDSLILLVLTGRTVERVIVDNMVDSTVLVKVIVKVLTITEVIVDNTSLAVDSTSTVEKSVVGVMVTNWVSVRVLNSNKVSLLTINNVSVVVVISIDRVTVTLSTDTPLWLE